MTQAPLENYVKEQFIRKEDRLIAKYLRILGIDEQRRDGATDTEMAILLNVSKKEITQTRERINKEHVETVMKRSATPYFLIINKNHEVRDGDLVWRRQW
jgi:hypothetical protein